MDWLSSMHRSPATALPEDSLVFLTQHWLRNHAGNMVVIAVAEFVFAVAIIVYTCDIVRQSIQNATAQLLAFLT